MTVVTPASRGAVACLSLLQCSSVEAPYISRHVALRLGCDVSTPALIVNRLCGSGFQSIVNGAHVSVQPARVSLALERTGVQGGVATGLV